MKEKGCVASTAGYYLVVVGAVNWGLVGIGYFLGMNFNVVNLLLGSFPLVENVVYILVGLAAVMTFVGCKCSTCKVARGETVEAPKV